MPSVLRQKRVADRVQQEISQLFQAEMNDPRLALVTVTRVNIDRELEYANVFVSTVTVADEDPDERRREVMGMLERAKGFIRRELARRIQLRRAPEIVFHWDPAPEKAEQIVHLLDELQAGQAAATAPGTDDNGQPPTGDDGPANVVGPGTPADDDR